MRIALSSMVFHFVGYSHGLYATRYVCHTICVCFISGMTGRSSHWRNQATTLIDPISGGLAGSKSVIAMFRQQLGSYIKLAVPDEGNRHEILRRCDESDRQRPNLAAESASSQLGYGEGHMECAALRYSQKVPSFLHTSELRRDAK